MTDETKKKISLAKRGKKNPKLSLAKKGKTSSFKGKHFSEESKLKLSMARMGRFKGSENPNWRGGITKLSNTIRTSVIYKQWNKDVFERDNYTCKFCGKRGGWLEVDHIKPFSTIMRENNIKTLEEAINCEELWNRDNGRVLCRECHKTTFVCFGNQHFTNLLAS